MPFKLKLKKSRQYNVVSKNLFVISVEMLDNTVVECTLSSQSIGYECLQHVCQRLCLQQPMYFGLRFLSKRGTFWWIDLERPLKKQLDKYAQECCLYLGVMFYVSDVNLLHDEVSRYHYFLQIKKDVIDGKLHCSQEQAFLLAGYSLQAEFGDHDPKKHTIEYLNNFVFLPKNMTVGKENQEAAIEQAISTHISLQNLSPVLAEVYYIMEAQQLEGYGQERFSAKDLAGAEVTIGISTAGILAKFHNGRPAIYFNWNEIINIVHHKRVFGIQCHKYSKPIEFQMEDSQYATYVWKMCINQHRFYTEHELNRSTSSQGDEVLAQNGTQSTENSSTASAFTNETPPLSEFQASQESLDELAVYHTEGRYSERVPLSSASPGNYVAVLDEINSRKSDVHQTDQIPAAQLNTIQSQSSNIVFPQERYRGLSAMNDSAPSLSSYGQTVVDPSLETRRLLLPTYRHAPDYETAIQSRYGAQSTSQTDVSSALTQLPMSSVVTANHGEVSNSYQQIQPYYNYSDVHSTDQPPAQPGNVMITTSSEIRPFDHVAPYAVLSPEHTYSSPELASQGLTTDISTDRMMPNVHLYYQYKPPPPYPYGQRSSSSTPDLTRNIQGGATNSDLVLHRNAEGTMMPQLSEQHGERIGSEPNIFPVHAAAVPTRSCQSFTYGGISQSQEQTEHSQIISPPLHYANSNNCQITTSNNIQNNNPPIFTRTDVNYDYVNANIHQLNNLADPSGVLVKEQENTQWKLPVVTQLLSQDRLNHSQSSELVTQLDNKVPGITAESHWQNCNYAGGSVSQEIKNVPSTVADRQKENSIQAESIQNDNSPMGPMLVAAMNGLTISRPDIIVAEGEDGKITRDTRIQQLESRLAEGQVFLEFEGIIKKKPGADYTTALLPDNIIRNRFKDVLPYEENRVVVSPTKENRTGYINASHINMTVVGTQKLYIAAQGPLSYTVHTFWQMIWEHNVTLIVMLTEVQEQGREKCFPYWPQSDNMNNTLQLGEFQITRNFSVPAATFTTCSLTLTHSPTHNQRDVWHIQYTDWPDHSCPQNLQGFLSFMEQIDAVRRMSSKEQPPGRRHNNAPVVVHCSAGVGRSGVVILCDIMLYALDHNEVIDMPKVLTQLRLQRTLTVQTLAQYKFVYTVLIQYLKNSRLI